MMAEAAPESRASSVGSGEPGLVRLDHRDDGVAVITLDNGKVNALSVQLLMQLHAVALYLHENPPGAVVLTGGDRLFAAGADVSQFAKHDGGPFEIAPQERVAEIGGAFLRALNCVAEIPRPTIASISGFALGGGCELALACDFRIASTRARLGQPEILLGIIPGGGGTQRLSRLIGPARAKDLVFSGRQVDAGEALAMGLVDEVVEPADLEERTFARAAELAAGPSRAIGLAKEAIDRGLDSTLQEGLLIEQQLFVDVFGTDDASIGVRTFLEHGPGEAEFTGR